MANTTLPETQDPAAAAAAAAQNVKGQKEKKDTPTEQPISEKKIEIEIKKGEIKNLTGLPIGLSELEKKAIAFPTFRGLDGMRREEDEEKCQELGRGWK